MSIEQQNAAMLEAAEKGAQLPAYTWATGCPNCPPTPPDPAEQHRVNVQAEIAAMAEKFIGHHRGYKNLGRNDTSIAGQIQARIAELREELDTAKHYNNDLTRTKAFVEYAAQIRFLKAVKRGIAPTR